MIAAVEKGGKGEDRFSGLDLSGVQFPSDRLTIRGLRQAHPDLFDIGFDDGANAQPRYFFHSNHSHHAEDTLAAMLCCERMIAVNAYAAAKGVAGLKFPPDDAKDELSAFYTRYGLATGTHHAAELIREIEQQGAALANQIQP